MKSIVNILVLAVLTSSFISCSDEKEPNYQFMPNMYGPVGYETYGEYEIFPNEQSAMLPVEGTIPRGYTPYDYEDTNEDRLRATEELKNPLPVTEENLAAGSQLYTYYCAVCHGDTGDGKGILATREKFLGIPSYADPGRNITEGSIYHVQMYGLNAMGSYASQTSEEERWQITMHVQNLMADLKGTEKLEVVDEDSETMDPHGDDAAKEDTDSEVATEEEATEETEQEN